MDFLKTCVTNIQRLDDIHLSKYTIYTSADAPGSVFKLLDILADLRQLNILCCEHIGRLYIFNAPSDHKLESDILTIEEEGSLAFATATQLEDRYQDAVEQGVSFRLASNSHMFKLGLWSWICFSGQGRHSNASLIRLHVKFVLPGTLLFASSSKHIPLSAISRELDVTTKAVILSPSGEAATLVESNDHDRYEDDTWKADLRRALRHQGVVLGGHESWTLVELDSHPGNILLWPTRLCLAKVESLAPSGTCRHREDSTDSLDPLTFAQQWAESAEERQQALLATQTDDKYAADTMAIDEEMELVTSPPFQYRPGLSNMAGVYPTPPDGMTNNALTQPSIPNEQSVQSQSDLVQDNNDLFRVQTNDRDNSLGLRLREPSVASSRDMDLQPNTDDLFGDGDGDAELAGGEVDDGDFDFFDDEGDDLSAQVPEQSPIAADIPAPASKPQDLAHVQLDDTTDYIMADTMSSPMDVATARPLSTDHSHGGSSAAHTEQASSPLETRKSVTIPKSLSPFDIRERLLPPPVPASLSNQNSQGSQSRRQSTFAPIAFNPDLRLGARAQSAFTHAEARTGMLANPIETPSSNLEVHHSPARPAESHADLSSSEDDTSDSSIEKPRVVPPDLPWQTRKRKRLLGTGNETRSWDSPVSPVRTKRHDDHTSLLSIALKPSFVDHFIPALTSSDSDDVHSETLPMETYYDGGPKDLLMIAQLASEQAVTCTAQLLEELDAFDVAQEQGFVSWRDDFANMLQELLPSCKNLDPVSVALPRDSQRAAVPINKGQPRPPPRPDNVPGTEIYPLAAPYLRFQRGETKIEMLPPAVHFWEALSLVPANAGKDVQLSFVFPHRPALLNRLTSFHADLSAVYEGCKLGVLRDSPEAMSQWSVEYDGISSPSELFHLYQSVCVRLASHLVEQAFINPACSFVIVMVESGTISTQMLCACFWSLYKTYRDRVVDKGFSKKASDVCLQLVPASLICSSDNPVLLSSFQTATLAREIYDRCPPNEEVKITSPLSISTVPSLVLADPLPKRINFQVTANTPTDLLHEGSELHVAYAKSADGLWITAVWSDNTGAEQQISSFCLRGTTVAAVFTEIWNRSLDILRARPVSWRLGIATAGVVDDLEIQCWRDIMSVQTPRRVAIHASFVLVQSNPLLAIRGPSRDHSSSAGPGSITPVSTPQPSGFTVSPDASGQTAPVTPAPTEPSTETDPDAYLVDLPDETWGVLLETKHNLALNESDTLPTIAQGALIKHGDADNGFVLPVAGISVAFTLRIRGSGNAAEDATAKQAEIVLRELLSAYRGLSLLAKARGLHARSCEALPLHIVSAQKSVSALDGLLRA